MEAAAVVLTLLTSCLEATIAVAQAAQAPSVLSTGSDYNTRLKYFENKLALLQRQFADSELYDSRTLRHTLHQLEKLHKTIPEFPRISKKLYDSSNFNLVETSKSVLLDQYQHINSPSSGFGKLAKPQTQGLLRWLRSIPSQDKIHTDYRKDRLPGTCKWLQEKSIYKEWTREDFSLEDSSTFWLQGEAGTGKTIICSKLVDDFRALNNEVQVVYCYIGQRAHSPVEVASTLLTQVCSAGKGFPDEIYAAFYKYGTRRPASLDDILPALTHACGHAKRPYVVFIDALDLQNMEVGVNEDIRSFSRLLSSLRESCCKLFITSRSTPSLLTRHTKWGYHTLQVKPAYTLNDVRKFAEVGINHGDSYGVVEDKYFKAEIVDALANESNGLFPWVTHQMQRILKQTTPRGIKDLLERDVFPISKVESICKATLQAIHDQPSQKRRMGNITLSFLSLCRSRLGISSFKHLLGILDTTISEVDVSKDDTLVDKLFKSSLPSTGSILNSCASIIQIEPATEVVSLIHQDITEYLKKEWHKYFEYGKKIEIASALIKYLMLPEFRSGACETGEKLLERLKRYPLYQYASLYWGAHVSDAFSMSTSENAEKNILDDLEKLVLRFLKDSAFLGAASQASTYPESELQRYTMYGWPQELHVKLVELTTPLHVVSRFGLSRLSYSFIDKRSVDIPDEHQVRPLHEAAKAGSIDLVERLINEGANLHARDKDDQTPFDYAAKAGKGEVVRWLKMRQSQDIQRSPSRSSDFQDISRRSSALSQAATQGHKNVIEELAPNAPVDDIKVSIYEAAQNGKSDSVKALIGSQSKITPHKISNASHNGNSALVVAVRNGHLDVVKILLDFGANPDSADRQLQSCLHHAIRKRYLDIAQIFLDFGADINKCDAEGKSPLFVAAESMRTDATEFLLLHGTNLSHKCSNGDSVLHNTAKSNAFHNISLLIDQGMPIDEKNETNGHTPLMVAAMNGHSYSCKELIARGANVHARDVRGNTALMLALEQGHKVPATMILLETTISTDLTHPNLNKENANDIARRMGIDEVRDQIEERVIRLTVLKTKERENSWPRRQQHSSELRSRDDKRAKSSDRASSRNESYVSDDENAGSLISGTGAQFKYPLYSVDDG